MDPAGASRGGRYSAGVDYGPPVEEQLRSVGRREAERVVSGAADEQAARPLNAEGPRRPVPPAPGDLSGGNAWFELDADRGSRPGRRREILRAKAGRGQRDSQRGDERPEREEQRRGSDEKPVGRSRHGSGCRYLRVSSASSRKHRRPVPVRPETAKRVRGCVRSTLVGTQRTTRRSAIGKPQERYGASLEVSLMFEYGPVLPVMSTTMGDDRPNGGLPRVTSAGPLTSKPPEIVDHDRRGGAAHDAYGRAHRRVRDWPRVDHQPEIEPLHGQRGGEVRLRALAVRAEVRTNRSSPATIAPPTVAMAKPRMTCRPENPTRFPAPSRHREDPTSSSQTPCRNEADVSTLRKARTDAGAPASPRKRTVNSPPRKL